MCRKVLILLLLLGGLTLPAGALTIFRVDPDESLADANCTIQFFDDHIEVDLVKEFKSEAMIWNPLDLRFVLDDGDVGKEIWILHGSDGEEVLNGTGVVWTAYEMALQNVSLFTDPYAGAAFNLSGSITSDRFSSVLTASTDLYFSIGTVADGQTVHFSGVKITHSGGEGDYFDLKQLPIPEPGTLILLAAGAIAFLKRRKPR